ncbi:metallophosphoesterase family protein [Lactiplantibacillus modestisalitolerans]|uniref:Metallophosphoesterase family protein n=1 Tax=Lactiplantibacillus modestisalitolerans TaxID=1457219 RepID=A0ABV5WTA0_9LACO|nr:metallophosphoesterase [Lactiplantibacillus modestisalitolerans]
MTNKFKTPLLVLALSCVLLLGACQKKSAKQTTPVQGRTLTAMVISDDHVIAPSLHDNGSSFQTYAENDGGADLKYSATIFKAFIEKALQTHPDVLLISGDITNNGEKASHEYVARQLKRLHRQGIRVYVVPGNHDINNPLTRRFKGKHQYEASGVGPEEFTKIYKQAGYGQAAETDPNSLSYLAKPSAKTWFLMLNSAIYRGNYQQGSSTVGGGLTDGTLKWVAKIGKQAKKQGATVIPVLHHNTMDHMMIHQDYTIGYAEQVRDVFTKAGIKLALTGHIHAQNIASQQVNGQTLTDIASGSLIIGSHYYGTLKIDQKTGRADYHATPLDVSGYLQRTQDAAAARAFKKYDHHVLYAAGYNAAIAQLYETRDENHLTTKQVQQLAAGMGQANIAMFRGTPPERSAAIRAWEKQPASTSLRTLILRTLELRGNLSWSGAVR